MLRRGNDKQGREKSKRQGKYGTGKEQEEYGPEVRMWTQESYDND